MRQDFLDDELFGNEAGEDENPERLASYYLEKAEYEVFSQLSATWNLFGQEKALVNLRS